jgi:3-oxoacyl-[acyl-carrier protein] reductase
MIMASGTLTVDLSGKTAVITGGGRGIGRAIAACFAGSGAAAVLAARTTAHIEEAARFINGQGGTAHAVTADVTDYTHMENLFREAEKLTGGIDIVVANAGGNITINPLEKSEPELWKQTFEVNSISVYYTARAAIPYLKKRGGGKLIVIGSGAGFHCLKNSSAYSSAKAALHALVKVLAEELSGDAISVNEIVPGPVNTELFHDTQKAGDTYDPGGEWLKEPEDVASLALYLAAFPGNGPSGQTFSLRRRPLF